MLQNIKKFFNIHFKIEECQDEVFDVSSSDEENGGGEDDEAEE